MAQDSIPAVARAITVLEAVAAGEAAGTIQEMAARLRISRTTLFRILTTLERGNWIARRADGRYHLAAGLAPVAHAFDDRAQLVACCRPAMEQLVAKHKLAVKLSVREGNEQVTLARVESPLPVAATGRVGARLGLVGGTAGPALLCDRDDDELKRFLESAGATAVARRQFLAAVRECRKTGVCARLKGHPRGIQTLSAPVRNPDGAVAAALTLIGLLSDIDDKNRKTLCRALTAAAAACAERREAST